MNQEYITVVECMERFNISRNTIYRRWRQKKLRLVTIGTRTYVDVASATRCFNPEPVEKIAA
jgi:hypothetical protein